MSGPTRGMVAGQAIQTQAQTKEYDEGFERTFGERKRARGRFRWNPETNQTEPIDADWTDAETRAQVSTEEIVYGDAKATDGTPINTRKRHREYLQRNGLAMMGDFSDGYRESVAKSKERADDKHRREIVERAFYKSRGDIK